MQDIATVAQEHYYKNGELTFNEGIRVLVYADKDSEDYTNEFNIGIYKEES